LLALIYDVTHHQIAGLDVSDGFAFLGAPLTALAAGFVGAAFLGARERRSKRLLSGAVSVGLSNAALCVSLAVEGGLYASHHAPGTFTASLVAAAVGEAVVAGAFLTGAWAFGGSRAARQGGQGRDRRLGIAAAIYAGATLVEIISAILALVALSNVGASTTQIALDLAAALIQLPVAILLAVAFFRTASSRQFSPRHWLLSRDRFLACGFSALLLANLVSGIGSLVKDRSSYSGLAKAASWLGATGDVTLAAAFACAAAAFLISGWRTG
jgi:hypothetical protein